MSHTRQAADVGLRWRLFLMLSCVVALCLGAAIFFVLRLDEAAERVDGNRKVTSLLATLSVPVAATLGKSDDELLSLQIDNLAALLPSLSLDGVAVYDAHGNLRAQAGDPGDASAVAQALVRPAMTTIYDAEGWAMHMAVPLVFQERVGTLYAIIDGEGLRAHLQLRRVRLVGTVVAVAFLAVLLAAWFLSREVLRPLRSMVAAAERLSHGEVQTRAPVAGATEMRRLALAMNEAATRLNAHHDLLIAEVARRTAELGQKNEELTAANVALEKLALTDALTALPNRRYLEQALAFEVTRQRRSKQPFSIMMVDVDHFKHFNDRNGHPEGDVVLRELATILQASLRKSDVVARVGGEEFVVLLLDTELPLAKSAAEKVRLAVQDHDFPHGEGQPHGRVTISVGVASFPMHGDTSDVVMTTADKALYFSKQQGRNRVSAPEDMGIAPLSPPLKAT